VRVWLLATRLPQPCQDQLGGALRMLQHVIIGHPQHVVSTRLEVRRALSVTLTTTNVAQSVNFNDQSFTRAAEVRNKGTDYVLSLEFEPAKLPSTKNCPQSPFWKRHLTSQIACPPQQHTLIDTG